MIFFAERLRKYTVTLSSLDNDLDNRLDAAKPAEQAQGFCVLAVCHYKMVAFEVGDVIKFIDRSLGVYSAAARRRNAGTAHQLARVHKHLRCFGIGTHGKIFCDSHLLTGSKQHPRHAAPAGLGMIHQHVRLRLAARTVHFRCACAMRAKVMVFLRLDGRIVLEARPVEKVLIEHHRQSGIEVGFAAGRNALVAQAHETHTGRNVLMGMF